MLEPADAQRSTLLQIQGTLGLVQYLVIKKQDAFNDYLNTSERTIHGVGGRRTHSVSIDQFLAGGEMSYQAITVDLFPNHETAIMAFDAVSLERQAALADIYALVIRPAGMVPRIAKTLGFLAPLLSRLIGTRSEREMTGFAEQANPETGPVPETIAVLRGHDQTTPFFMMNLNKFYPIARYEDGEGGSGEQAYNRYATRIMPYLISVGGYPDLLGHTLGVFVGDESSPLHDAWSEFIMVYYPSRINFIRMMTNTPREGVHHRDAGLQRAVLMPSTIIP